MLDTETTYNALRTSRYAFLVAVDAIAKRYPDYPPGGLIKPELLSPSYVAPSRANEVIATALTLGIIAFATVCLRFVVIKRWPGLSYGAEDLMLLFATIGMVGLLSIHVNGAFNGIGRHVYDVTWDQILHDHRWSQPNLQTYTWTMFFSKMSNLFFTRRITPREFRWTNWTICALFAFQTAWTLAASLIVLLGCIPVRAQWDLEYNIQESQLHRLKCFNGPQLAKIVCALFVTGDLATMILPVMLVLQLRLPRRTKFGVGILFALGIFVCIANAVKIKYFVRFYSSWDTTYFMNWNAIEVCFSVITVCLPALDMVLVKLIPSSLLNKLRAADTDVVELSTEEYYPSAAKLEFVDCLVPQKSPYATARLGKHETTDTEKSIDTYLQYAGDTDDSSFIKQVDQAPIDERRNSTSWLSVDSGRAGAKPK